jgi:hypothetical protein
MATSTRRTAAAALVGALLGSFATYAWMQAIELPQEAVGAGDAAPHAPESRDALRPSAPGAPKQAPAAPRAAPDASAPRAAESPVASALASVEVTLPARAEGTITGNVRTKDGTPLAGAVVRATVYRKAAENYRRGRVPPRPQETELVRSQLEWAKWHVATLREAVTDASGAYTLAELWDADHSVSAFAEGHEVRAAGNASNLRAGAVADFVATRIVDLPVRVVDADGSVPARVQVRWSVPERGGGSGGWWLATDPVVRIEPGTWSIHAEIDRDQRSEAVTVTVPSDAPAEPVTLRLARRNALEGAVRFDPADTGWEYVHLTLHPTSEPGDRRDKSPGARPPDWKFRFDDLEPGEYELSASLDGIAVVATSVVRIEGGTLRQDLVVPRIPASHVLEAVVTGPGGPPGADEDLQFGLRGSAPNRFVSHGARPSRRPDGTYMLPLRNPADEARSMRRRTAGRETSDASVVAGGGGGGRATGADVDYERIFREQSEGLEWKLVVTWKGRGTREVPFVPGETRRVDLRFD